jgi:hypothetical protein
MPPSDIVKNIVGTLHKLQVELTLATLQAAGVTSTATFSIGAPFVANTRYVNSEIQVVQALAGTLLVSATGSLQTNSDAAPGTLVAASSLTTITTLATPGTNPYPSRGGQQLTLRIVLVGSTFNSLSAGDLFVRAFYAVIP